MLFLSVIVIGISAFANAQDADKIIRTYFSGYEKKDWSIVANQLCMMVLRSQVQARMTIFPWRHIKSDAGVSLNSLKRSNSLKLLRRVTVHLLFTILLPQITRLSATPNIIPLSMVK